MNRIIDIGEDKNFIAGAGDDSGSTQSKFLMDDLAKTPDEALNEARKMFWSNWINSDEPLLAGHVDDDGTAYLFQLSEEVRNRVVLFDFWDYTLLPCRRSLSYLLEWHKRYSPAGLLIIGIHAPMFHFGTDKKNVLDAVRALGIEYPVVMDNNFDLWRAFENRYWPRRILLDSKGRTQQDFAGEGGYALFENTIQHLLRDISPGLPCPPVMKPVRQIDVPEFEVPSTTEDIFFGIRRGARFGNPQSVSAPGEEIAFTDLSSGNYALDTPYLGGSWIATEESMYGAPGSRDPISLTVRFRATDVYLVATSRARNPVDIPQFTRVTLTLDGNPVAPENMGPDVVLNEQHRTPVTVREPRLYHLVKGLENKDHELRLEVSAASIDTLEIYGLFFEYSA